MSSTKSNEELLIEEYLSRYKFVPQKDRSAWFGHLLEEARLHAIPKLIALFEGLMLYANKSYPESIAKFQESLKYDAKSPYPWNGLGNVYVDQKEYASAEEAYRKAIALDQKFAYPWNGLGHLYTRQKEYSKAVKAFSKAVTLDEKFTYAWNGLGNAYSETKEYDKAEEAYRKAIALDESFMHPLSGLGALYEEQHKYEKAEEYYHKAIKVDPESSLPWNGIGIVHSAKKEFPRAEEAYRKAISLDKKFVPAWNGLGVLYAKQKDYAKAEDAYRTAVSIDETAAYVWHNLGLLFFNQNKFVEALPCFRKAKDYAVAQKDVYLASVAKNNLSVVVEKVKEYKAISDVRKTEKSEDILATVLSETKHLEDEIFENQKSFQSFVVKPSCADDGAVYLKVLRRWNSYTPIVSDNSYIGKGGGYFLKVGGKGIVIDPGFNFIDNFKRAGHAFDEIDAVIISHAHNDHTSDLESILTLLNNCNKRRKGVDDFTSDDTVRADIAKSKGVDIRQVTEDEIEKFFITESPRRKKIDLYLTKSVEKKFNGMLTSFRKTDYDYHVVEKCDVKKLLGGKVEMTVLEAKHDDIVSDRDAVGFAFDFEGAVLIYTGDTGWDSKIEKQYQVLHAKCKGKSTVLLAHIGGFKDYENKYLIPEVRSKAFYKNHLGRLGLAKLVATLKPNICFISEFGEEMRRYRERVAEIYDAIFKSTTQFLPADIGLEYHIKEKRIRAITKLNLDEYDFNTDLIDSSCVKTCLLRKDYSLHYFDGSAKLKESDLVQILIERFDRSSR